MTETSTFFIQFLQTFLIFLTVFTFLTFFNFFFLELFFTSMVLNAILRRVVAIVATAVVKLLPP